MNILVIQHVASDPPALLGECLVARGAQLKIVIPTQGDPVPLSSEGFAGLIVMGGPMNAEEDANYPHLKQTVELIQQFDQHNQPVLGICLGAQLIARAFGQRVYRHDLFELGFTPVVATTAASTDPLLQGLAPEQCLMQWHFDTFDLPHAATLLMTSATCQNQVYRIGKHIYGFQFHFEVTAELVQNWVQAEQAFLAQNYPDFLGQVIDQLQIHTEASQHFCYKIAQAWADLLEAQLAQSRL
ncbi:type 1 glutamine amidotransferase [Leptolyngbya sp. FACHB-261]|uniref:type 1 glutamine amidotransferase n=1 Tax=Leptolyngbya sp. FACHB-261 TaxID=2692806 RepID=UPI001686282E|nr:type 1 glutamine amidotransferase [Leptolyngbya sp. FACHB-261]MBD2103254.1 gamma-glutamyl-gamma-aminobutyrate hydrolase family protein [Leptolyngbya sp. FACHB-261]